MPLLKLYATFRKLTGKKELVVKGASVGAALGDLIQAAPVLDGAILENDRLRPHIVVTLNGHAVTDMDLPVSEKDVLAVFPPIAGGQGFLGIAGACRKYGDV